MNRNTRRLVVLALALFAIATAVFPCSAGDMSYARRTYRLGATISEIAALAYPDSKDWPGGRMFFSSEQTYVWATDAWLPLADIRKAMHRSWKENEHTRWVPIKDIRHILPFEFTDAELEGDPEPYRHDENNYIKPVKKEDLAKYADVLCYVHPPQADLPTITYLGAWADAGVIKGELYYPQVDRKWRSDHKPRVSYSEAGLWLGDQWATTTFYFYQPTDSGEPLLFYVETTGRSDGFERIKGLFAEANGTPTSVSHEPVQNRMGAVFQNEIVEYRNETSSMILKKYDSDLNTGSVVHVHWPTFNKLKAALGKTDREAASRL